MINYLSQDGTLGPTAEKASALLQKRIQQGNLELPLLPGVASDVLALVQDKDSDASGLAKLIQSDQALAGHVMRIANSALYSPGSNFVSLQQAIARLGMNMISEIAFAASVNAKTFHAPGYEDLIQQLWRHSLASALWGKEVARKARKNVEAAFLCGLLHNIGMPVVLQALVEIMSGPDGEFAENELSEQEVSIILHRYRQVVGSSVANLWKLPDAVAETINYFENYYAAPTVKDVVALVFAGSRFATYMFDSSCMTREEFLQLPVIADLNLYEDEVEALWEKTPDIQSTIEALSV